MSKELDEILKPYECTSEHACKHKEQLTETKDKLTTLLSQVENKVRLDEAQQFNRYFDDNYAFKGYIEARIATLQGDKK